MSSPPDVFLSLADARRSAEISRALEASKCRTQPFSDLKAFILNADDHSITVVDASEFSNLDDWSSADLRKMASIASHGMLLLQADPSQFYVCDSLRARGIPAEFFSNAASTEEIVARIEAHLHNPLVDLKSAAILELTQTLASSLEFRDILHTVVKRVADVVDVDRVSIVLAPYEEELAYVVVASDDKAIENLPLDLAKYPEIQQVLRSKETLTIADAKNHPLLDGVRGEIHDTNLGARTLVPIVWEQRALGVLFIRSATGQGTLSEREAHFCRIIANATAVAMRNARVLRNLRDQSKQVSDAKSEAVRKLSRYAALFNSFADGIALVDMSGKLIFANPRTSELIGADPDQLDRPLSDFVHESDAEKVQHLWEGFEEGIFPRDVDIQLQRSNKTTRICSCAFAPFQVSPEDDSDLAILVSLRDVTEQRRTEAELVQTMRFIESLIDASVDGIVAADMKGNILLFNSSAERIYGWEASEVVGQASVTTLYPKNTAFEIMRMLRAEDHGGVGRLSPTRIQAISKTGEPIPLQITAAMIYQNGKPTATFGIFTDLRERLNVEERLAEAQKRLKVSERQAVLAELAGTAAHELNQPLTSVMAYAELLARKIKPGTAEHHAAEIMVREAERMAEIVKKIGKMTKYETTAYVGEQRILDLDRSADRDSGIPGPLSPSDSREENGAE